MLVRSSMSRHTSTASSPPRPRKHERRSSQCPRTSSEDTAQREYCEKCFHRYSPFGHNRERRVGFAIHKSGILDADNIQFIGIQHGIAGRSIEPHRVPTIAAQESPTSDGTDKHYCFGILLASAGRLRIDHCSYALEVGLHERSVTLTRCGAPHQPLGSRIGTSTSNWRQYPASVSGGRASHT
jgi:hypothetical protein